MSRKVDKTTREAVREELKQALGVTTVADKTVDMVMAIERGLKPVEAYQLVTGKLNPHRNSVQELKSKHAKWSLTSTQARKLTYKAVTDTLKMKPVPITLPDGTIKTVIPKVSDRLAAAAMVADRVEPKKVITESHNNHEYSGSINFEHYANQAITQDVVIEAESEPVVSAEEGESVAISEG